MKKKERKAYRRRLERYDEHFTDFSNTADLVFGAALGSALAVSGPEANVSPFVLFTALATIAFAIMFMRLTARMIGIGNWKVAAVGLFGFIAMMLGSANSHFQAANESWLLSTIVLVWFLFLICVGLGSTYRNKKVDK